MLSQLSFSLFITLQNSFGVSNPFMASVDDIERAKNSHPMKKVLIVDDYEDIHNILTLVLSDDNIKVDCLSNGTLLSDYLDTLQPDLIMLDVRLDNADGREICEQIKSNPLYNHIKVVLMSAMPEGWKDVPCYADAKVDKPFDIDEVRDLVLSLLNSHTHIQKSV